MATYLFDKEQRLMKIVPDNHTLASKQTQEITDGLLNDYLTVTVQNNETLLDSEYMAVKAHEGNSQTFDMYRITNVQTSDDTTTFTGIQLAYYELAGYVAEDIRPVNRSVSYVANQLLNGTEWRVGYVENNLPNVTDTFYYLSVKDSFAKLQEIANCEVIFKVEISGQGVTDKWVEIYSKLGDRTLKRFNYGSNALTVEREIGKNDIYTALIGRGKGEETGDGYGRKLTFEDVAWTTASGNPVNKPKGQKYVEIPQATAEYGIKTSSGKVPRIGIVEFSEEKDAEKLLQATYNSLVGVARPQVQFKSTVINIGSTNIGDTVTIHRHDLDIHYETRVYKVVRDKLDDNFTEVTLGDAVTQSSTRKQAQFNSTINSLLTNQNELEVQVNYVSQTADGKNNINYGNVEPNQKRTGDLWFRDHPSLIGESQMLIWDGNNWIIESDTSDLTKVQSEVAKHTDEIADVTQSANDAVAKADQAIEDAGFIKLDVAQVKTDALTTAGTAQSAYNNAGTALNKADTAISTTGNLSLVVDDLERAVTFKADSSRVDTISGKVDSQAIQIKANADGLVFKADKSAVDTISQTVSQHTNDISINAQAINARLTETQVNNLVSGKNYVNQTQLNTTANGLQLDITKVSTDLTNLEIGGRNLLANSNFATKNLNGWLNNGGATYQVVDGKNVARIGLSNGIYQDTATPFAGIYSYSFLARAGTNGVIAKVGFLNAGASAYKSFSLTSGWKRYSYTTPFPIQAGELFHIYSNGILFYITEVKVEEGGKATDWSLAPEDQATLEQFTTLNATVNGLQITVGNKADDTKVTQLAAQWTQTTNLANGHTGQIANLGTDINLRVTKADLISQINVQSNNILIQSGKLYLDAASVVFSGNAFIPSAAITSLKADKITAGTLNAANVNIINLNVSEIVGLNSNFIQSNWNQNGSDVVINAGGLISQTGNLKTTLNAGQITNSSGTKSGTINALGMQIYDSAIGQTTKLYSEGIQFDWYGITRGITQTSEGLEIKPTTGSGARLNSALHLTTGTGNDKIAYLQLSNIDGGTNSRLEMNRLQLSLRHPNGGSLDIADYDYNGQLGRINSGKFRTTTVDGRGIQMEVSQISALAGNQTIYIMPSGTGELRIGDGSANPTLWPVRAQSFVQGSSRNYKTNIKEYKAEALSLLNSMNVVEYDLIKDVESGVINKQIGFISEDSHSISSLDEKGIDIYKTTAVSVKGIQQLSEITYKHEMKIAELEKIIIELKGDK